MSEDEWREARWADFASMYERLLRPAPDEEYLLGIVKGVREAVQTSPAYENWLTYAADALLRLENGTIAFQVKHASASNVTSVGAVMMAPMGAQGAAIVEAVSLPDTTGDPMPVEPHSIDYQHAAAVLLCVIAWLVYFAGPAMIAKLPSADQTIADNYWSLVPGIAVALTGYILVTQHKRK